MHGPAEPLVGELRFGGWVEWFNVGSFRNVFDDFFVIATVWFRAPAGVSRAEGTFVCDVLS